MKARVKINSEIDIENIMLGEKSLYGVLKEIHSKVANVISEISIQNQSENPNFEHIDVPLHSVLNRIEVILFCNK